MDARARLGELVDRAEAGDAMEITRRGKPVARLVPIAAGRKLVDAEQLRALMAGIAPQSERAADLVRSMRDSDRC
jgi:prevent-host-death family protein